MNQENMDQPLGDWTLEETRVMGVLIEKAITTPDQYPLSLNALTLGCNQKTSRDPITDFDDGEVEEALTMLRDRRLVYRVDQAGARVPKFQHRLIDEWLLESPELALMALLLLRGPQTTGQLRQRCERMYMFRDVDQVRETLEAMMDRHQEPECLIIKLPLQPGSKEVRYAHTLCPAISESAVTPPVSFSGSGDSIEPAPTQNSQESLPSLRTKVTELENELARLRQEFEDFKAQF